MTPGLLRQVGPMLLVLAMALSATVTCVTVGLLAPRHRGFLRLPALSWAAVALAAAARGV